MTTATFRAPRSAGLRLWHWLDALAIFGLLGTAFLRKTWLSWRANAAFLTEQLAEAGHAIPPELAKELAVGIRAPMWDWHYRLGMVLAALVAVRVVVAVASPAHRPFAALVAEARALSADRGPSALHRAAVRALYAAFYVAIGFMAASGLSMYFHEALGLTEAAEDALKEAHELLLWPMAGFVALHLLGVVVAELRGDRGLVSDMIHGGDR